MCDNCEQRNNDSSFIFGIVIGAVIGACVAIYIYKNNRSEVFLDLKKKLSKYFAQFMSSPNESKIKVKKVKKIIPKPEKITVTIPKNIESINLKPTPKVKPQKMFVKK